MSKLAFIGSGRWATALALRLARLFDRVSLYDSNPSAVRRVQARQPHLDLPEAPSLPESVSATDDPAAACARADFVIFATPSSVVSTVAELVRPVLPGTTVVITVTKGFDPSTDERLSVVLSRRIGRPVVVLAGPGIPYDFALGDPTSLVAASTDETLADRVRDSLTFDNLRVYSQPDIVGVEVGAATKNIIALAAGIGDGLGLGINAKSALVARGLAEMTRLGRALGADAATFGGLAGVGDLVVTAFSDRSRNYSLGRRIGKGDSLSSARAALGGVIEGVDACVTATRIARQSGIELPIAEEVRSILHEGREPSAALRRLMARPPRKEVWS